MKKRTVLGRALWIFAGYSATVMLIAIFGVLFSNLSGSPAVSAEIRLVGEVPQAFILYFLVRYYFGMEFFDRKAFAFVKPGLQQLVKIALIGLVTGCVAITFSLWLDTGRHAEAYRGEGVLDVYFTNGADIFIIWIITSVTTAPFVEEMLCRGVLFSLVDAGLGGYAACFFSCAAFIAVHLPQVSVSPSAASAICLLSVVLSLTRLVTGSVVSSVVCHIFYNLVIATVSVSKFF